MESNVTSRFDGFNSHSQIVMQCHPMLASVRCSSRSRSLFRRIFATQKSLFVLGILQHPEFSSVCISTRCPCQKQPFTKIHVLYFLSTKSGCPGNRLWFNLYRKPLFHKPRRTINSGFVSFEWIEAIFLCRCCGVRWSIG